MFTRLWGVRSALRGASTHAILTAFLSAALLTFGSSAFATCVGGAPNNVLESGEVCDEGAETPTCDNNCTTVVCGDGHSNEAAGEQCDDGDSTNSDFCLNNCLSARCGDGVTCTDTTGSDSCANSPFLDGIEACDTTCESVSCDDDCTAAECSDGSISRSEHWAPGRKGTYPVTSDDTPLRATVITARRPRSGFGRGDSARWMCGHGRAARNKSSTMFWLRHRENAVA